MMNGSVSREILLGRKPLFLLPLSAAVAILLVTLDLHPIQPFFISWSSITANQKPIYFQHKNGQRPSNLAYRY